MIKFPNRSIPRWVIFIFDVFISLFALAIAYTLRFDFFNAQADFSEEFYVLKTSIIFFIGIRVASFLIGKSYAGIIRFTSIEDTKRIFKTVTLGTVIIIIVSVIRHFLLDGYYLLPIPIIIIEYLATLFLMISARILVKLIYHEGKRDKQTEKNVIVYGAGEMGMVVMRTFKQNANENFKVVAFIDDDAKKSGKILNGIKIYESKKLKELLSKNDIQHVILAIKNPNVTNENYIIDTCLSENVTVLNIPPIEQWMNGELNIKQIKQVKIEDLLGRKEIVLSKTKIQNDISNKTVLVTGAAGSIGSEIVRQLVQFNPSKIILLDQAETPIYDLEQELINHSSILEPVIADVSNYDRLIRVFEHFKPQLVFHAAAYKHVPLMELNPCEAIQTNILGTQNLAKLAGTFKVEKFVMISTDKAVNPTNVMGASKRIAEIIVEHEQENHPNTAFITTRFGNVLGSNGSVIPLFKKQIEKGGPLTVTHKDVTRYFMTIPEACQLVLEAGSMGTGGEIYVFDMGESVKIIDLATRMIRLSGFEPEIDIKISITGLRPGEKLYEELLSNDENTLPTHHEKILIGQVRKTDTLLINNIDQVIERANKQKNKEAVSMMKIIVPEFVSNNSEYNSLD